MVGWNMKNSILEAVDHQLDGEECPFVKDAFQELTGRGYSEKEAKEKIGAVLLENIYAVLRDQKKYDEARYRCMIDEMLREDET